MPYNSFLFIYNTCGRYYLQACLTSTLYHFRLPTDIIVALLCLRIKALVVIFLRHTSPLFLPLLFYLFSQGISLNSAKQCPAEKAQRKPLAQRHCCQAAVRVGAYGRTFVSQFNLQSSIKLLAHARYVEAWRRAPFAAD